MIEQSAVPVCDASVSGVDLWASCCERGTSLRDMLLMGRVLPYFFWSGSSGLIDFAFVVVGASNA